MRGRNPLPVPAESLHPLSVGLMPLGKAPGLWLPRLASRLEDSLGCRASIISRDLDFDFSFALIPSRGQFSSTNILLRLREEFFSPGNSDPHDGGHSTGNGNLPDRVILAVTDADLCVPIFTFVFGEAIDRGPCTIVSGHRLRQEFYGLPGDVVLFEERLLKMATHEIGHTQGLRHCAAYRCVMATSYAIERVDLKSAAFCPSCAREFSRAHALRPAGVR